MGLVIDFGAGDGRFAVGQSYAEYIGYEIDPFRRPSHALPSHASIHHACAFAHDIVDADVCIGTPPYVRNQDLPDTWDDEVGKALATRTGVHLSGLANAWQYFFLLSLASTKPDGLVALVIPYEWVSRPSVRQLREFIENKKWDVQVYRLLDETFDGVMTTASITIVDKKRTTGRWTYFEERQDGTFDALRSPANSAKGVVAYLKRSELHDQNVYAKRGLSPGTQKALVLTESARLRHQLVEQIDVVPCITSLRPIESSCVSITPEIFNGSFREANARCWLVNTARVPSEQLRKYLNSIPVSERETATCAQRAEWWKFVMPEIPSVLAATGFTHDRPKIAANKCGARAVGSVTGIYGIAEKQEDEFVQALSNMKLDGRIVPHSNGLRKVEINQMNALINDLWRKREGSANG